MAPLLHRAAIKNGDAQKKRSRREVRGVYPFVQCRMKQDIRQPTFYLAVSVQML